MAARALVLATLSLLVACDNDSYSPPPAPLQPQPVAPAASPAPPPAEGPAAAPATAPEWPAPAAAPDAPAAPAAPEVVQTEVVQTEASAPALALAARDVLAQRCVSCHGDNGVAEKDVFVLDHARLVGMKLVVPGDSASRIVAVIDDGDMPADGEDVPEAEVETLRAWLKAGAPAWPRENTGDRPFVTNAQLVTWIRDDLAKASERDRPWLRYYSLAHLANAGLPAAQLDGYRVALSKLVNSLSWHRRVTAPQAVDAGRLLLRVDLRDYKWTDQIWGRVVGSYPYGGELPAAPGVTAMSGALVPFVRVDWFVAHAAEPPLYHDMLELPDTVAGLEARLEVDAAADLDREKDVIRAAVRKSGVSQHNRVVQRHISRDGAYWKSYDFRGSTGMQDVFQHPLQVDVAAAGGEMIFNLPNGLQAYFLADDRGRRVDVAPVDIVADRTDPADPEVTNGRSCMGCHFAGVKHVRDDMRPTLEALPLASFDREKALALYRGQAELDRILAEDRARYQAAVKATGGRVGATASTEPITVLAKLYRADLTLARAAAELGHKPQALRAALSRRPDLASGLGGLLTEMGGVKRDVWEEQFPAIAGDLAPRDVGRRVGSQHVRWNDVPPATTDRPSGGDLSGFQVLLANDFVDPSTRRLHALVRLEAPAQAPGRRGPVNLALVIDRSGSMRGDKLADAKKAAIGMLDQLNQEDRVAVVSYAGGSRLDQGSTRLDRDGRRRIEAAIRGISAGGGTALAEGLREGYREIRRTARTSDTRRVVLVSDGRPTVGITDRAQLDKVARAASQEGIVTTTLGLGLDYNEDLMTSLATEGGGGYHYAERSSELPAILRTEAADLAATVARQVTLTFDLYPGVSLAEVYGYAARTDGSRVSVSIGDMAAARKREILVELRVPTGREGAVPLGRVSLDWRDATRGDARRAARREVRVTATTRQGLIDRGRRPEVAARIAEIELAMSVRTAARLAEQGDFGSAGLVLQKAQDLANKQSQALGGAGKRLQRRSREAAGLTGNLKAAEASPAAARSFTKKAKKKAFDVFVD